jgi:hypothetical protein
VHGGVGKEPGSQKRPVSARTDLKGSAQTIEQPGAGIHDARRRQRVGPAQQRHRGNDHAKSGAGPGDGGQRGDRSQGKGQRREDRCRQSQRNGIRGKDARSQGVLQREAPRGAARQPVDPVVRRAHRTDIILPQRGLGECGIQPCASARIALTRRAIPPPAAAARAA